MKRLIPGRFIKTKKKFTGEDDISQIKSAYTKLIAARSTFNEVTEKHSIDNAVLLLLEAEENYRRVMNQVRRNHKRGEGNELNNNHDLD